VLLAHRLAERRGAEASLRLLVLLEPVLVEEVLRGGQLLDRLVDLVLGQLDSLSSQPPRSW